jgi:hypothetical protein
MQAGQACRSTPWLLRVRVFTPIRRAYATRFRPPFTIYQRPPNPPKRLPKEQRLKRWAEASDAELERKLAWIARNLPSGERFATVSSLVDYMHKSRHITPAVQHYEALILANADRQGSISNVRQLLSSMEAAGLPASGLIDNAVLEVRLNLLELPNMTDAFLRFLPCTRIPSYVSKSCRKSQENGRLYRLALLSTTSQP